MAERRIIIGVTDFLKAAYSQAALEAESAEGTSTFDDAQARVQALGGMVDIARTVFDPSELRVSLGSDLLLPEGGEGMSYKALFEYYLGANGLNRAGLARAMGLSKARVTEIGRGEVGPLTIRNTMHTLGINPESPAGKQFAAAHETTRNRPIHQRRGRSS